MDPKDLLNELMTRKGVNPNSLAEALKLKTLQSQLFRFLSGETKEPRRATLKPVADFFGVNIEAFYNPSLADEVMDRINSGAPIGSKTEAHTGSQVHTVAPSKFKFVWVVGRGSGGNLPERIWTDGDYPVNASCEYAEVASPDPHAFITEVTGDSMIPRYNPSEYALVEPGTEPEIEDDVLVRLSTGHTMIKRLLSKRGGYRLGSYNDAAVLHYKAEDVTWMYYVAYPVPARKIKTRI